MKLVLLCLALSACVGDPNLAPPAGPPTTSSGAHLVTPAGTTDQPAPGEPTCGPRIKNATCP